MSYEFTNDWFGTTGRYIWDAMLPKFKPTNILEVGSFEGRSACYFIDTLAKKDKTPIELHCIDTWKGGEDHEGIDMADVKSRFYRNIDIATTNARARGAEAIVQVYNSTSEDQLCELFPSHKDYFDFIYIDGSHQAADVLSDAVNAFRLLRPGGIMCFDDYLWHWADRPYNPIDTPKAAIDAFTMIYAQKLQILALPPTQLFIEKLKGKK